MLLNIFIGYKGRREIKGSRGTEAGGFLENIIGCSLWQAP